MLACFPARITIRYPDLADLDEEADLEAKAKVTYKCHLIIDSNQLRILDAVLEEPE